uniref:Putative UPF0320 protein YEL074W n=1 Tax=Saccharomyces cerevisiae (strain ATCC 204508 / S288c) TaxID=559292 RepID=YEI4_YEAST|nr:RecName: Full=Putative UPF0320 protein YEL074W [Saccharomyces cerevisiae S288C]AAB65013.1 Yer074wp [Saccharomyces cerevisiae]AAS56773.1 YEL074W [Saccharomyces cerevisiae]
MDLRSALEKTNIIKSYKLHFLIRYTTSRFEVKEPFLAYLHMARQKDKLLPKCITPPNKKADPFTNDVSSYFTHTHTHTPCSPSLVYTYVNTTEKSPSKSPKHKNILPFNFTK